MSQRILDHFTNKQKLFPEMNCDRKPYLSEIFLYFKTTSCLILNQTIILTTIHYFPKKPVNQEFNEFLESSEIRPSPVDTGRIPKKVIYNYKHQTYPDLLSQIPSLLLNLEAAAAAPATRSGSSSSSPSAQTA